MVNTFFRNAVNNSMEIDRTRRISLGQIHPARINTRILTNMITQVRTPYSDVNELFRVTYLPRSM